MSGGSKALRAAILRAGFLGYQYLPVPGHWKDGVLVLAFRFAGRLFAGERAYELWRRRAAAPLAPDVPAGPSDRPRVLVVDRYVPQPDRDAGSRSTACVLRALHRMGFAVTFWARDGLYDPDYVPPLQQDGITVLWGEAVSGSLDGWFARHGAAFDHVLLNRPLIARDFIPAVRRHSHATVVYYGHDLHHARLAREFALSGFRPLRWESALMERIEHALWRDADVVYYPSSEETEAVRRAVPGARAWTLPLYFFDEAPAASSGHGARNGIVFVAGFAHGPNADAARWLVGQIMPHVWRAVPRAHLWLVGSRPSDAVRSLAGPQVTVTGYVPDEELMRFYGSARVAAVPLRVGAGMKGKVVEALYHGLPLVTTTVGAQGLDGLPSIVPVTDEANEFASGIVDLLRDDARWEAVSRAELDYARARFSLQAMVDVLRLGLGEPVLVSDAAAAIPPRPGP